MGNGAAFVNLHRPSQGGRCGSSGFLPHPPELGQSLAVVTDRRGECDDPAAAGGLPHTPGAAASMRRCWLLRSLAGSGCGLRPHLAPTSGIAS